MPLTELEREGIEKPFGESCQSRVLPHVRHLVRIEYGIRGSEVKLFECRRRYDDPSVWTERAVARFNKDEKRDTWGLYHAGRNGKWHLFGPSAEDRDIEKLLAEADRDTTGIFWG